MVLVGISAGCLMGCFRAPPVMAENSPSGVKKAHEEAYDRGFSNAGLVPSTVFKKNFREQRIQPKVFLAQVFGNPLGAWTSAPSGHGCPRQNACFSRILTALTEVLGRDIRANDPRMSAGCPSRKLPLWAVFSFLNFWAFSGPCVWGRGHPC